MSEIIRRLAVLVTVAWRERRDERGGVSDDMVMIALLVGLAILAAGVITAFVTDKIGDIPGT